MLPSCSINQAPRLVLSGQELSLVLITFNWALAAGFRCLPLGLPEGLNKHELKEVAVWTESY